MVNLSGKTILVTGGCGFIGSNFLEYLYEHYENLVVINIDKHGVGSRFMDHLKLDVSKNNQYYELVQDLRNIFENQILFDVKIDYVFHFAAESHVDRSIDSPISFIDNNVLGISELLEFLRLHQPQAEMVNVSTDEVYGHLDLWDAPFTELSPLNPRSPYSASKASADLIVNSYVETYGLKIITTRCCNNYGPNQHDEKFIPTVIRKMMNGLPIPVYGTGENIREWIYVEDHIKSILDLVESGSVGWVYNIGSGVEKTNLDIVKTIAKLLEMSPNIEFVEDRKGHDFRYALESVRCWADFAPIDFSEGMQRTVDFYKGKWVNNKSE